MSQISFNLKQIASWQLDSENSKVELPALQRGFVWKVNQIESLWDSILRGFPIGSFLLSTSEDGELFLLDGQQRATSIALGYYNPWIVNDEKRAFWSLKNIPIIWIDLNPREKTTNHKFVVRVVTQSHPWGYQRINPNSILSVSDRKNALSIFKENPENRVRSYIELSQLKVFPFDADLPVPLPFVIEAIAQNEEDWKYTLISLCKNYLPTNIKTKHFNTPDINYIEHLTEKLNSLEYEAGLFKAIKNLQNVLIPTIVVEKEILKAEDEQTGDDPTLFVRLNSLGTRIVGEELIYSIYKASFPEAKQLVESIGANFMAPSLVISLTSRLAFSEINENRYPYPINVNDFRKRIQDQKFKNKLKEIIGFENESPARILFNKAFELLLSNTDFAIPPVIVKNLVKSSPDLFLMLLKWIEFNKDLSDAATRRKILATITALSWFGTDNTKFVRESWENISVEDFWNKQILGIPFYKKRDFVMYPLISPNNLRKYLIQKVAEERIGWNNLTPDFESSIVKNYKQILSSEVISESDILVATNRIWSNFINKLFWNKSIVLFAQRSYINQRFGEFNQMETLDDMNTPWDWDHIYPSSWVYGKWYIDQNTKHWTNSMGNFRAISLEENRSEGNNLSPQKRLEDAKEASFVMESDWEYWKMITSRINQEDDQMIKIHLCAIINRFCNIYDEWYTTLKVGDLFNYEND